MADFAALRLRIDSRECFDPSPQVIGKDKSATTTLDRAKRARVDGRVERRSSGAGDRSRLRHGVSKRGSVHVLLAIDGRGSPGDRACVSAGAGDDMGGLIADR